MTTPGGVPNLPVGALTLENLQSRTQDTSVEANRARANERISGIFSSSSGGDPASDLSPFGVLSHLFSGFNSVVSQADPADIQGPDDLPGLLLDFIHELPVVGQFVDLLEAFGGTYDGDDPTLLEIQRIVSLFLGPDSLFNAANLYGQFGIPITWLNNNAAQGLWNPGFDGPNSVVGVNFQWDGTVYRTLSTDHVPGSVRITADGAVHALRSNPYDLKAGDKLDDISVRVAWSGLSAAPGSTPMQISLLVMDGTGTQYVDIASVGAAGGAAAAGWTGLPAGAQGATLTGDWTAATDCTVVLRLVLDETAAAGDIWFDAADMPVIGNGIPTEWLNALVAAFAKLQAPFKTIDTLFDPDQWQIASDGLLDILGLELVDNQIILDRDSIWTRLFQSVIPASTLNLHPDMTAVNEELAIIFNPFDNNNLDRAEAWDDLMGLIGIESHTADSVAWWNNLFAANKSALANQSGVTDLAEDTRKGLNFVFGQLGFGYLNSSWVWTSGTPSEDDLPESGFTSLGGAPPAWLADILRAVGVPVSNDLPSQLDPTIPAAPLLLWPSAQVSASTSVPQNTNLYYVATLVHTASGKESAPSNEVLIYIAPSWLVAKAQVTVPWLTAPPAGHTISLYRRQSPTGQYRRVASGLTGTSTVDRDASTTTTTQPGSAAATAAGVINGQFTTTNGNHQNLMNAVTSGAAGSVDGDADAPTVEAAVADLRGSLSGLQGQVSELLADSGGPAGGVKFAAYQAGWQPGGGTNWDIFGNGSPVVRSNLAYGWTKTGAGKYVHGLYKTKKLTSAQQSATLVFQTAPAYPSGFDPKTYGGSNLIIIRAKDDGSKFPFVQIWQNAAQFGYWNGSSHVLVGSAIPVNGTAAGGFVFRQIDGNNPYTFELLQGTTVVATYTYTSAQAPYGGDYLSVGQGMISGTGNFGDEFAPGDVNHFSAKDAGAGAGLISSGIGARMSRLSALTSSIGANQNSTLPYNFFDQIDWLSAGIHRMPSSAGSDGLVFDEGGLYVCHVNFQKSVPAAIGGGSFWSGPIGARTYYGWQGGTSGSYIGGTGIIPIEAGETISPAAINLSTGAFNVFGDAAGATCYFSVAKVA